MKEARMTYVGSVLVHQVVLTLLLMILLVLGIWATSWSGPAGLPSVLMVLLWAMPFLLIREFVRHLAFAHLQPSVALAVDIGASGLQIGGLLLFAAFDRLTIPTAFGVMGLSCAATSLVWLLWKREPIQFERRHIWKDWQQNLAFGQWSLLSMLLGSAAFYLIPWIRAGTVDVAESGVFYACQTLVAVANMFALGFSRFLSPRAARAMVQGGISELVLVLKRGAMLFVVVLGVFSLAAVFAGGPLVQLVYGGRYAGASLTFGFLALSALAGSLGIVSGNGLWALDRPSLNIPADIVTFVITITTAIAITGSFGALGAAVATFAGIGVGSTVRAWTLRLQIRKLLGEAGGR
jgi:O-antigen/teichoic acid export membrane protein